MQQTPDWSLGDEYLRENAPELIPFLEKYSPCTLTPSSEDKYFGVLLTGIVAQQLPPEVSVELMGKLAKLAGGSLNPEGIAKVADEDFIACGLAPQKIEYVKNFAQLVLNKEIDFSSFAEMTEGQIMKKLLTVRGLGQWTIEMFMLLSLCRTDILPGDDFLLKKEIQQLFNLDTLPKRGQIVKLVEKYRPWRSLVVWYLWANAASKNENK